MSERWPGGFIKPIPPTPAGPYQDGAASGVWTMDQMSYWLKQGLWPIAGNALDWGDLTVANYGMAACSNAHGGL